MIIRAVFIAPKMVPFRNCLTLGDMIEYLYGSNRKILAGVVSFLFSALIVGVNISYLGFVFENLLGFSSIKGIIISSVFLGIYSSFGGMRAVTSTDIFQFIFLIIVLILLSGLLLFKVGGIGDLIKKMPDSKFILFNTDLPTFITVFPRLF